MYYCQKEVFSNLKEYILPTLEINMNLTPLSVHTGNIYNELTYMYLFS